MVTDDIIATHLDEVVLEIKCSMTDFRRALPMGYESAMNDVSGIINQITRDGYYPFRKSGLLPFMELYRLLHVVKSLYKSALYCARDFDIMELNRLADQLEERATAIEICLGELEIKY